eukprot:SM000268S09748  [mRNA]  locus=s268:149412:155595:- [translate_table: standard]
MPQRLRGSASKTPPLPPPPAEPWRAFLAASPLPPSPLPLHGAPGSDASLVPRRGATTVPASSWCCRQRPPASSASSCCRRRTRAAASCWRRSRSSPTTLPSKPRWLSPPPAPPAACRSPALPSARSPLCGGWQWQQHAALKAARKAAAKDGRRGTDRHTKEALAASRQANDALRRKQLELHRLNMQTLQRAFVEVPKVLEAEEQAARASSRQQRHGSVEGPAATAAAAARASLEAGLRAGNEAALILEALPRAADKLARRQPLAPSAELAAEARERAADACEDVARWHAGLASQLEEAVSGPVDGNAEERRLEAWAETRVRQLEAELAATAAPAKEVVVVEARDRVLGEAWFNEGARRWEMSWAGLAHGAAYGVVGEARLRHDWRAAVVRLKGSDSRLFFVDLRGADGLLEGGVAGLAEQLRVGGAAVRTEVMWVPFDEWDPWALATLPARAAAAGAAAAWRSPAVQSVAPWYLRTAAEAAEEWYLRLIHERLPAGARYALQLEFPDDADVPLNDSDPIFRNSQWLQAWPPLAWWLEQRLQAAQARVAERYGPGSTSPAWWISLPARTAVVVYPLGLLGLPALARALLAQLGPRQRDETEVEYKRRLQSTLDREQEPVAKEEQEDPIRTAFDKLKARSTATAASRCRRPLLSRLGCCRSSARLLTGACMSLAGASVQRVKRPEVRLADFAGIDSIKEEILEVITFLRDPRRYKEVGARPPRGVLIVGEAGTGKSALARAIAAEARVPMVEFDGSELEGGLWVGQGAANVRDLFKTARENVMPSAEPPSPPPHPLLPPFPPSFGPPGALTLSSAARFMTWAQAPLIVFMDNFDHFAGVRGQTADTRKQDHESLINQLLVELDGFETQEGVVLLATSSRPWAIDPALRRPGRMDRTIQLPMPNAVERLLQLNAWAHRTMEPALVPAVDWRMVAEKTGGMTPGQLKNIPQAIEAAALANRISDDDELANVVNWLHVYERVIPGWLRASALGQRLARRVVTHLGLNITPDDVAGILDSLDFHARIKPGIELRNPPIEWTREMKLPHAVWAAGRAVLAALLPAFHNVTCVWLDPTSWDGIGFCQLEPAPAQRGEETTRSFAEKQLVLHFGPHVAARLILPFGENNNLAHDQLKDAELARTPNPASIKLAFGSTAGFASLDSPLLSCTCACQLAARMVMECGWGPEGSTTVYQTESSSSPLDVGDQHELFLEAQIEQLYDAACNRALALLERNRGVLDAAVEALCEHDYLTRQDMEELLRKHGAVPDEEPFELLPAATTPAFIRTLNAASDRDRDSRPAIAAGVSA